MCCVMDGKLRTMYSVWRAMECVIYGVCCGLCDVWCGAFCVMYTMWCDVLCVSRGAVCVLCIAYEVCSKVCGMRWCGVWGG